MNGTKHKAIPPLTPEQVERFWNKVRVGEPDKCWPWLGQRNPLGYGIVKLNRSTFLAPRILLRISTGDDPGESVAMHSCNNPPCCNPTHVTPGTMGDNTRYAIDCGRFTPGKYKYDNAPSGEEHYAAKLTQRDVQWIRLYHRQNPTCSVTDLAAMFAMNQSSMWEVIHCHTWRDVPPVSGVAVLPKGVMVRTQLEARSRGAGRYNSALSEGVVREARRRYTREHGLSIRALAKQYGVSFRAMWAALNNETWKHVTD